MSLANNIKKGFFWINVLKIGMVFLLVVAAFSLFFKTGGAIFSGDFETVYNVHFANNQWVRFWLSKIVISLLYAMYTVNKKMK
ncbi:conserved protein of unknown function [Tenacibaculum sp. 190130A14a]|uniref:Uncharacterized protein n=1 Tax=Tenacibaculum polynesiense TaxID=3137857 RepID=A0ABM9P999_9FLAO